MSNAARTTEDMELATDIRTADAPPRCAPCGGYLPVNLAREYLRSQGQTLEDWEGICGELANAVIGPNDHILHVEPACLWKYHMVPLIDGLVHDAWCGGPPVPIKEWLIRLCGHDVVTVALDGEDIYSGPANLFEEDNSDLSNAARKETAP